MEILEHSASEEEESQSLVSRELDSDQIDLLMASSSGLAVLDLEKQAPTNVGAKDMDRLIRCLYGSHFLSRWGDRCEFKLFIHFCCMNVCVCVCVCRCFVDEMDMCESWLLEGFMRCGFFVSEEPKQ